MVECLQNFLQEINENEKFIKDEGDTYTQYFRGQSNATWDLEPSVFREHLYNEHNLFSEMERNLYHELSSSKTTLDKLVFMQHHLLPTRLLDITKNPLVALYFACITEQGSSDGAVYMFNEYEKYDKREGQIIALLSQLKISFELDELQELIEDELHYNIGLDRLKEILGKEFVLIKSNRNNNRVIKQDGDFFIFSNNYAGTPKIKFNVKRDNNKIVISKTEKKSILLELEKIGVHRYSLFPEPDHLAKYLKSNLIDNPDQKNNVRTLEEIVFGGENTAQPLNAKQLLPKSKLKDYLTTYKIHNEKIDTILYRQDIFSEHNQEIILKTILKEYGINEAQEAKEFMERL